MEDDKWINGYFIEVFNSKGVWYKVKNSLTILMN